MQFKTTMRYHLTLVRMAIIKKSTNSKYCRGYGEKGILLHCCPRKTEFLFFFFDVINLQSFVYSKTQFSELLDLIVPIGITLKAASIAHLTAIR